MMMMIMMMHPPGPPPPNAPECASLESAAGWKGNGAPCCCFTGCSTTMMMREATNPLGWSKVVLIRPVLCIHLVINGRNWLYLNSEGVLASNCEKTLQTMLMLISVFWCPPWSHIFLICTMMWEWNRQTMRRSTPWATRYMVVPAAGSGPAV